MTHHILFPFDGSKCSLIALNYVQQFAMQFQSQITVVKVYDLVLEAGLTQFGDFAPLDEIEQVLHNHSRKIVNLAEKQLEQAGLTVNAKVLKGYPGEEIIKEAQNSQVDLIIIGSQGYGPVKRFLLGSVSQYVIHHSPVPVLLVPSATPKESPIRDVNQK